MTRDARKWQPGATKLVRVPIDLAPLIRSIPKGELRRIIKGWKVTSEALGGGEKTHPVRVPIDLAPIIRTMPKTELRRLIETWHSQQDKKKQNKQSSQ